MQHTVTIKPGKRSLNKFSACEKIERSLKMGSVPVRIDTLP